MPPRRAEKGDKSRTEAIPTTVDPAETDACFIVRDANRQALAYVYFEKPGRCAAPDCSPATRPGASPRSRRGRRNWSRRRLARMRIDSLKHPNQAYAETSPAAAMPQASVAERPVCAPALLREIAMSQTYSRYSAHDFERRWQKRLSTPPRRVIDDLSPLHVKVTHRFQAPNRYSWELRPATGLPVEESRVQFASWEEASRAGKLALNQFLQTPLASIALL